MADSPFSPFTAGFGPGLDFMQSLMKNAGAALPGVGQWVTPTLDPAELDKRISELRTVQFWLEQNARMLTTTIQALEVQKMTLTTLRTMNVRMDDLRESLMARPTATPPTTSTTPTAPAAAADAPAAAGGADAASGGDAPPAVDPMRWWGSLTEQFTSLATQALRDGAAFAGQQPAAPATAANEASTRTDPSGGGDDTPATAAAKAPAGRAAARKAARKRGQDER
ncbi:PhaM family polyhydroxyalkanoate granule multifunctional regulatory protein [Aquabacterium sp. J223]|uniref:PhaM family polyhydroxyalkanoate granule multifunctional regulatory protein n=1 Tax=Aquabacterium sp. J223 TaxID=2898431 RepID=UPI0021AD859A|nr:PhaM family polyhydroxyalkanoate granule multifunctional regulatory protein [Aquabacterium sp. J223]UUX96293.1 hypothetical protein LRS07_02900 [Aquabacterium sp. J223]